METRTSSVRGCTYGLSTKIAGFRSTLWGPRELGSIGGVVGCTNPREIQNRVLHAQPARWALSVLTPSPFLPWTGPTEYLARTTQTRPVFQRVLCPVEACFNWTEVTLHSRGSGWISRADGVVRAVGG